MKTNARETILGWNLEMVKRFLVNRWGFSESEADNLIVEYRRFMILSVENPEEIIPVSDKVDEVWHAHLLFTEDYPVFCQAIVGEYLHHRVPGDENERLALAGAYGNTLELYRQNFGQADRDAWGESAQICWCETITRTQKRNRAMPVNEVLVS